MTVVARLASFVVESSYDDLSEEAGRELKIRVLDALGCAFGALGTPHRCALSKRSSTTSADARSAR